MRAVVTVDGHDYVFVNDIVKATRKTPRLQRANAAASRVGPDIQKGYDFVVRWVFEANDGRAYYLTPEWSRILLEDTERVSDAA
jgi:hypothetical protein